MFVIDSTVALRVLREDDAAELFALTDSNRAYLRRWLPWVDLVTSEEDSHSFLTTVTEQREQGRGPTFGVLCDGALAGVVGFLPVDRVNRIGEIGYWLAPRSQGRGVMTQCCRFAVRYGFLTLDLNGIPLAPGTVVLEIRARPDQLGFNVVKVSRARQNLYGTVIDHAIDA